MPDQVVETGKSSIYLSKLCYFPFSAVSVLLLPPKKYLEENVGSSFSLIQFQPTIFSAFFSLLFRFWCLSKHGNWQ
jgi:hypothetical protein